MEKQPSFDRIIGGTEKQKHRLEKRAEVASLKTGEQLFGRYLVDPTPEEIKVIDDAVTYANKIANDYGSSRKVDKERIFVLKSGGVEAATDGQVKQGVHNSYNQTIGIDRSFSNAMLASSVVHEAFHATSPQADQIFEDGSARPYRNGLSMHGRSREGEYFAVANEAIVATLTRKFFDDVTAKDPVYKKEVERTSKIKEWLVGFVERNMHDEEKRQKLLGAIHDILILPRSEDIYALMYESDKDDVYKFGYFSGFFNEELKSGKIMHERAEEREKFDKALDAMISDSRGQLGTKEELFDQFARAHFTGNYLPLARLVEKALGKGAFRKIATELGEMKAS